MKRKRRHHLTRKPSRAGLILGEGEATLLDLVDSLLDKGVMVDGELILGVADVDLVYIRLSALLAAVDAVLGER